MLTVSRGYYIAKKEDTYLGALSLKKIVLIQYKTLRR